MKQSLIVLVTLTLVCSFNANSQVLEGSQWVTHWSAPINDSIRFNFMDDTLYITNLSGPELITTAFVESNDTMWVTDISGPYACSPTDEGVFKFAIMGGVLNFTTISDRCIARATFISSSPLTDETLSVDNASINQESINIYPNPASAQATIEWVDNLEIQQVDITNVFGQVVYSTTNLPNSLLHVDCSYWNAGIYLVRVHGRHGVSTRRIIVE